MEPIERSHPYGLVGVVNGSGICVISWPPPTGQHTSQQISDGSRSVAQPGRVSLNPRRYRNKSKSSSMAASHMAGRSAVAKGCGGRPPFLFDAHISGFRVGLTIDHKGGPFWLVQIGQFAEYAQPRTSSQSMQSALQQHANTGSMTLQTPAPCVAGSSSAAESAAACAGSWRCEGGRDASSRRINQRCLQGTERPMPSILMTHEQSDNFC